MNALKVFVTLCPLLAAANNVDDHTNLMQYRSTVASGKERQFPDSQLLSGDVVRVRLDIEGTTFKYVSKAALGLGVMVQGMLGDNFPSCGNGNCGKMGAVVNATCWCDDSCQKFGDCCWDYTAKCAPPDNSKQAQILSNWQVPAVPAGCQDMGSFGSGPNCEGNENICTTMGMVASGYYTNDGVDICRTGYKVRCALCPAGSSVQPVPTPAPAPAPTLWVAPPTTAAPPPPPAPTAPPAVSLPDGSWVAVPVDYDDAAIAAAQAAVAVAQANVTKLQQLVKDANQLVSDVKINISKASQASSTSQKQFLVYRKSAVKYAKKRELANMTIFRAQKDMNSAYFGQQGAAQSAQQQLAIANNYGMQKRYFAKLYVDKRFDVKTCQRNVNLAKAAVLKANDVLKDSKSSANINTNQQKSNSIYGNGIASNTNKLATNMQVKGRLEKAYAQATGGANFSNDGWKGQVAPWGGKRFGWR